jgi:hypothetical protein
MRWFGLLLDVLAETVAAAYMSLVMELDRFGRYPLGR